MLSSQTMLKRNITTEQRLPQHHLSSTGRAAHRMCMEHLHPWGTAGSIFLPTPVAMAITSPGWWHGSQQTRHGYAEAKGHFSELSAAAHLCISLGTLRHEDQVHRKQRDLQVPPNQPLRPFPFKCFSNPPPRCSLLLG